jgi:predicted Fe-Mo cluster-binding NifX family protein
MMTLKWTRIFLIACISMGLVLGTSPGILAEENETAVLAVAADGPTPDAHVSRVAARCPYFLLFDAQGALVDVLDNPHAGGRGGAGPRVVEMLAAKGVRTVVAETFGEKMAAAMHRAGMASRTASGRVADAVRQVE